MDEHETRKLIADAGQLCRAIAPDFDDRPLYILCASMLGAEWDSDHYLGFAGPSLDRLFRAEIGDAWRGRGPCILINDSFFSTLPRELRRLHFMAVVVHECGHVLSEPWSFEKRQPRPSRTFKAALCEHMAAPLTAEENAAYVLHDHKAEWLRASVHLHYRAARLEPDIPLSIVLRNALPRWMPSAWSGPLAPECETLIDMPIREVLKTEPPAAFSARWRQAIEMQSPDSKPWSTDPVQTQRESTMNILDKITSVFRKRERTAIEGFDQLVKAVADGKTIDPDKAAMTLDQANKSPADLMNAVAFITNRRAAASAIAKAADVGQQRAGLDNEAARIDRERNDAVAAADEAHYRQAEPLRAKYAELDRIESAGSTARNHLIQTAPVEKHARVTELRTQLVEVQARRAHAERSVEGRKMYAEQNRKSAEHEVVAPMGNPAARMLGAQRAERELALAEQFTAGAAELVNETIPAIDAEISATRQRLLEAESALLDVD